MPTRQDDSEVALIGAAVALSIVGGLVAVVGFVADISLGSLLEILGVTFAVIATVFAFRAASRSSTSSEGRATRDLELRLLRLEATRLQSLIEVLTRDLAAQANASSKAANVYRESVKAARHLVVLGDEQDADDLVMAARELVPLMKDVDFPAEAEDADFRAEAKEGVSIILPPQLPTERTSD